MRKIALVILLVAAGGLLAACGQSEAEKEREARLAALTPQERRVQSILDQRCVKCHTPPDAKKNLDLTDPHYLLPLINSELIFDDIAVYNMLMGDSSIVEHQPGEFQLKQDEIDLIRRWILTEHPEHGPHGEHTPETSSRSLRPAPATAG